MALEVWQGGLPIIQSVLVGRHAQRGQYALAASGLAFAHLLDEVEPEILSEAVCVYGAMIDELGWFPGDREKSLFAGVEAMARLAADGIVPDLFGFAEELGLEVGQPPKSVLLEAS